MPYPAACGRPQHSLQLCYPKLPPAFCKPAPACRQRCLAHQAARSRRRVCQPAAAVRGNAPAGREVSTARRRKGGETELRHGLRRPGGRRDDDGAGKPGRFYFAITGFPFPLGPLLERRTVRYEVERGVLWMFEQEQSLANSTATNVRMVAIRLAGGGLWIHAPIAPTRECVALVRELPGEVEHIVLPTFAVEHKQFVGPFSRAFPRAKVHVAPRQWSWPLWLPVQFLGIFPSSVLRDGDTTTPWAAEIEQKLFSSAVGIGPYQEVAFFHRRTRTLLVTDAAVYVPTSPPTVVREETLMDAGGELPASVRTFGVAKEAGAEPAPPPPPPPANPVERQRLGWQRMALQILYFIPGNLQAPGASFEAIVGRLLVSPVLQVLVFGNARQETRRWVDDVTRWNFRQIIPCHFEAPVKAGPREFRAAFDFAYDNERGAVSAPVGVESLLTRLFRRPGKPAAAELPAGDMRALDGLAKILRTVGVLNK